jgi:hypothetical protein
MSVLTFLLYKFSPVVLAFAALFYYVKSGYPYPEFEMVELSLVEKLSNVNISERY